MRRLLLLSLLFSTALGMFGFFKDVGKAVKEVVEKSQSFIKSEVQKKAETIVKDTGNTIKAAAKNVVEESEQVIKEVKQAVKHAKKEIGETMEQAGKEVVETVEPIVNEVVHVVKNVVKHADKFSSILDKDRAEPFDNRKYYQLQPQLHSVSIKTLDYSYGKKMQHLTTIARDRGDKNAEDFPEEYELIKESDNSRYFAILREEKEEPSRCVVVFRSTKTLHDVFTDLNMSTKDVLIGERSVEAHSGFLTRLEDLVGKGLISTLETKCINVETVKKIDIAGHSLGGAIAKLLGLALKKGLASDNDLIINQIEKPVNVWVTGAPMIFKKQCPDRTMVDLLSIARFKYQDRSYFPTRGGTSLAWRRLHRQLGSSRIPCIPRRIQTNANILDSRQRFV